MSHELDKQIADLLGWQHVKIQEGAYDAMMDAYPIPGTKTYYTLWDGNEIAFEGVHLPAYSTDANAALNLVSGFPFTLMPTHPDFIEDGKGAYECSISDGDDSHWIGYGDRPAEAICRAWLARKGMNP